MVLKFLDCAIFEAVSISSLPGPYVRALDNHKEMRPWQRTTATACGTGDFSNYVCEYGKRSSYETNHRLPHQRSFRTGTIKQSLRGEEYLTSSMTISNGWIACGAIFDLKRTSRQKHETRTSETRQADTGLRVAFVQQVVAFSL